MHFRSGASIEDQPNARLLAIDTKMALTIADLFFGIA
jgi:hypothetical protein